VRKDVLVYLSGPITAKDGRCVERHVISALDVFLELTRKGIPSFVPQFCGMFPSAHLIDYDTWMAYDYAIINRCTHMLMIENWQHSNGAQAELQYALARGIPVCYSVFDLETRLGMK
jgi:hypothetical protein